MMKILITGANGQVGRVVAQAAALKDLTVFASDRDQLDITNSEQVTKHIKEIKPDVVINCAGYTRVDQAESEPDLVFAINCEGVRHLAESCKTLNIPLVHLSTDYIFDGDATTPYQKDAKPNPLNVYAKSKWESELILQEIWKKHLIVRTSWVFGKYGENFVKKMLQLGQERELLNIVSDQIGCPTPARELANFLVNVACQSTENSFNKWGVYHYCGMPAVSWYQFAKVIFEEASHITSFKLQELKPILAKEYKVPAKRPLYSVLDTKDLLEFSAKPCDWKRSLQELLPELLTNKGGE